MEIRSEESNGEYNKKENKREWRIRRVVRGNYRTVKDGAMVWEKKKIERGERKRHEMIVIDREREGKENGRGRPHLLC